MGMNLLVNGEHIMWNKKIGYWDYLSSAVTLELNEGDQLQMRLPSDQVISMITFNTQSTFSGFLLFPL